MRRPNNDIHKHEVNGYDLASIKRFGDEKTDLGYYSDFDNTAREWYGNSGASIYEYRYELLSYSGEIVDVTYRYILDICGEILMLKEELLRTILELAESENSEEW